MTVEPGSLVASSEELYRGITTADWWVAEENRPSSAAFRHPDFSVDIKSLAGSPAYTLGHLPAGSGIVEFTCDDAMELGFIVRREPDPENPDNHAHANVYSSPSTSQRKKMAQRLVTKCRVVQPPAFGE